MWERSEPNALASGGLTFQSVMEEPEASAYGSQSESL
jgi:hypothetical protein